MKNQSPEVQKKEETIIEKYAKTSNRDLISDYKDSVRRFELDRIYNHDPVLSMVRMEELEQVVLERMCLIEPINIRIL
jgi:hypothetical protein